jgi:hypothetical protein
MPSGRFPNARLLCAHDVRQFEIGGLEQERLATALRQRIGEAVAGIQGRAIASSAVLLLRRRGEVRLINCHWNDLDRRIHEHYVELGAARKPRESATMLNSTWDAADKTPSRLGQ